MAIQETFSNRGTKLGLINIPEKDSKKLQEYWNACRRNLTDSTAADILKVIKEINEFLE
jgi:hypothetical protein